MNKIDTECILNWYWFDSVLIAQHQHRYRADYMAVFRNGQPYYPKTGPMGPAELA